MVIQNDTYNDLAKTYDVDKIMKQFTEELNFYQTDKYTINKEIESKSFTTYEIKLNVSSNIKTRELTNYLKNDKGILFKGNYTIILNTLETNDYIQILSFEVLQNYSSIDNTKLNKDVWVDIEPIEKSFKKNSDELTIALIINGTYKNKVEIFATEYRYINLKTGKVTKKELITGEEN